MEEITNVKSFNWASATYTLIFFILGLIYYLYKYHNFRNEIDYNRIPLNQQQNINTNQNENRNNTNVNNNNQNNNEISSDPNFLNLIILVQGQRENHIIHKDTILRNFVYSKLANFFNSQNQSVYLIFQGTRLDLTKRLSYYPQIKTDSIVHCFITVLRSNRERSNSSNSNNNFNNDATYNESVISLHTIIFHGCFLICGLIILLIYKKVPEIFSKNILILLLIIFTLWLNQFSKIIAKYIIFRQINWRF